MGTDSEIRQKFLDNLKLRTLRIYLQTFCQNIYISDTQAVFEFQNEKFGLRLQEPNFNADIQQALEQIQDQNLEVIIQLPARGRSNILSEPSVSPENVKKELVLVEDKDLTDVLLEMFKGELIMN